MLRKSLKMYFAVAGKEGSVLRSIDIRASFLQAKGFDHEVFLKQPKDVKNEKKIWLLREPLYELNDASRNFG